MSDTTRFFRREHSAEAPDVLILDRRRRSIDSILSLLQGITVTGCHKVTSPLGATVWVTVIKVGAHRGDDLPLWFRGRYVRVLDRFYLPVVPDPAVAVALFDICAEQYELFVSIERNVATIVRLLSLVDAFLPASSRRVLDFGCGTGLAYDAVSRMGRTLGTIDLVGTDPSPAMLARAKRRGMLTLPWKEWRAAKRKRFDAVIASYVLHFGVTDQDLRLLITQIQPTGAFVANFHHASELDLSTLESRVMALGAQMIALPERDRTEGPIIICRPLQP